MSVTGFLHSFFHHFDEHAVISNIVNGPRKKQKTYKYYDKTYNQIKILWKDLRDDACIKGTRMHAYAEYYLNGLQYTRVEPILLGDEYFYLTNFFETVKSKWRPFLTEVNVCSLLAEIIG